MSAGRDGLAACVGDLDLDERPSRHRPDENLAGIRRRIIRGCFTVGDQTSGRTFGAGPGLSTAHCVGPKDGP